MKPYLILALCGALSGGGCHPGAEPAVAATTPAKPVAVRIVSPRTGAITRYISVPGEIHPFQQAVLHAKVTGYLKSIRVDTGDAVKAGDLIAEIEVPELLADREKVKAEAEIAALASRRMQEAQAKAGDLVTRQQVDDARARSTVANATLQRVEILLGYARITAPFDGVITRRWIDPGALVPAATAGNAPERAALVTIMDLSRIRIQAAVPELESGHLRVGLPFRATLEAFPGKILEAKISRFSQALDPASKTTLVEAEIPNTPVPLRPGMYGNVRIGVETRENVLLVPYAALVIEKGKPSVFLFDQGKAKKMAVQLGFDDGLQAELLAGVRPGDRIILPAAGKTIADGQAVVEETAP